MFLHFPKRLFCVFRAKLLSLIEGHVIWETCRPHSFNSAPAATWWVWLGRCWPSACTATAWALFRTHRVQWSKTAATITIGGGRVLIVRHRSWRSADCYSGHPSLSWLTGTLQSNFAEELSVLWCRSCRPTTGVSFSCCCCTTLEPSSSMESCPCLLSKHWKWHETHFFKFSSFQ